jgi:SAM-dependent methyltransferase
LSISASSFVEPDIHSSSEEYAQRFSGEVGAWMVSVQNEAIDFCLKKITQKQTLLDIGGGHGQVAPLYLKHTIDATFLISSEVATYGISKLISEKKIKTVEHSLSAPLPFPDKSFDIVSSIRILPHMPKWQEFISEACRVAKHAVIMDYPCSKSFNIISEQFFWVKKSSEGNTREFIVFKDKEIADALEKNNCSISICKPQFFFPTFLHRKLKSKKISSLLEGLSKNVLLTNLFGSPKIFCGLKK